MRLKETYLLILRIENVHPTPYYFRIYQLVKVFFKHKIELIIVIMWVNSCDEKTHKNIINIITDFQLCNSFCYKH